MNKENSSSPWAEDAGCRCFFGIRLDLEDKVQCKNMDTYF